jgi:beta-phosphoglucomutase-like phosphatase (HAD superfamily)
VFRRFALVLLLLPLHASFFFFFFDGSSPLIVFGGAVMKEARFRELLNESGLQPTSGRQPLLDKASQKDIPICCVTNAPRENVESMLDALSAAGLSSYKLKESLVVANELSEAKPSGLPYSHACIDICQASPENAIAFEDSTGGIRSAKNAQIAAVVGVETSKDADSLIAAGATISVRDFADEKLLNLLDG